MTIIHFRYMEASERCQHAEETIEKETARLNYLQNIVDEKLEEVYGICKSFFQFFVISRWHQCIDLH